MSYEQLTSKTVSIRKDHRCAGCNVKYPIGTSMHYTAGKMDGDFCAAYWCKPCDAFLNTREPYEVEDGIAPGDVYEWDDYQQFRDNYNQEHGLIDPKNPNPMQPIDYKTISPTWVVEQVDGDNVLRPECPWATIEEKYFYKRKSECESWGDYFVNKRKEWHEEHGSLSYPTSLQPGTYKAEDLPDAVWQWKAPNMDEWITIDAFDYLYYTEYKDFQVTQNGYGFSTRLYIPA